MNCRDLRDLAGSYLDGELPEELLLRVERHLRCCAGCREEVETLRLTVEALRACPPPPAGGEFVRGALARLTRELELEEVAPVIPGQLRLDLFRTAWREQHD